MEEGFYEFLNIKEALLGLLEALLVLLLAVI